jgi:hypothetical protein
MTETEWFNCPDPTPLLKFLRRRASGRKLRLFCCACCRRVWHLLTDESSRQAVEVAERYANGLAGRDELDAAHATVSQPRCGYLSRPEVLLVSEAYTDAAMLWRLSSDVARCAAELFGTSGWYACEEAALRGDSSNPGGFPYHHKDRRDAYLWATEVERDKQAQVLRDVFGNPFRPVTVESGWLTPTVIALAQAIYQERQFGDLPRLADAMEVMGCRDADILAHCRQVGEHVRGCWAVDLLLGKA